MTRKINESDVLFISDNYNIIKAKDIASGLGLTIHQVYEVAKKYKFSRKQNQEVVMNDIMNQIILSGILGDGRLKKNGLYNFYYSECHALGEEEYLRWKHSNLGDLTKHSNIYPKNANNEHGDALEFTTLTTPTLIEYSKMNRSDVINQLDDLGILLYMLDDGWTTKYKSGYTAKIAGGMLSRNEMELFADKCYEVIGIKPSIIGVIRQDLSFKAHEGVVFQKIIDKYNMRDLDVINKKFNK